MEGPCYGHQAVESHLFLFVLPRVALLEDVCFALSAFGLLERVVCPAEQDDEFVLSM